MNLKSRNNLFYRYLIESSNDIELATFLRRKEKAALNKKSQFFFELTKNWQIHIESTSLVSFLRDTLNSNCALLCTLKDFKILTEVISFDHTFVILLENQNDIDELTRDSSLNESISLNLLFCPTTKNDLKSFSLFYKSEWQKKYNIFWRFKPYNSKIRHSLTVKDIALNPIVYESINGLEIQNTQMPAHYELVPDSKSAYHVCFKYKVKHSSEDNIKVSVVIPSFNNSTFLAQVIFQLTQQSLSKSQYEVIVVEDGGVENSAEIFKQLFSKFADSINLTFIYWKKVNPLRGDQHFFRSGLARNLGSFYSKGTYLVFLDSDMLVPQNFIQNCIDSFESGNEIIQFQRFHIKQNLSLMSPAYSDINLNTDTYIEEKNYWSELFFSYDWMSLPNYWKYTCTYALGISKLHFNQIGMFKKYYVSYGFEDTDLGYEAHLRKLKFSLIKTPLLHLTSYDQMQYKNSFTKRYTLLRKTAELFFLQHLDKNIYHLLGNYYRMQKTMSSYFKDLIF